MGRQAAVTVVVEGVVIAMADVGKTEARPLAGGELEGGTFA